MAERYKGNNQNT